MIRVYKVTDTEARGPGMSRSVPSVSECQKNYPGLIAKGVVVSTSKLADMLDIAYNEGIKANQREIKRSLGL